jgi:hypothetical protein
MSDERSRILPTDPFDILLDKLIGLPNGAHTRQDWLQVRDDYGNSTSYSSQLVRTEQGQHAFIQVVNAGVVPVRIVLPPKLLAMIDRQRDQNSTTVRRRHGRRLAEERGNPFTPEMRAKALAARKRNARKKR